MSRIFNVSADCRPGLYYMVNIDKRLREIKAMVDRGDYFAINRARQYGKTTTLKALERFLRDEYAVLSLDFQRLSYKDFESEGFFIKAIAREILKKPGLNQIMPDSVRGRFEELVQSSDRDGRLADLSGIFCKWCQESVRPVVLMIDEVDSATNNQVFLDFLSQLRGGYIGRDETAAFQSVILAGGYDVRNLKSRFVAEDEHRVNSPWNIAADFLVDMSFSVKDIAGMLADYEADYDTGMDIQVISRLIYDYTSGYPFLVSRICKLTDERIAGSEQYPDRRTAWTREGIPEAIKSLLAEKNTLFESLVGKLTDYPGLRALLYSLLFTGSTIPYNPLNRSLEVAEMFGFIKNSMGTSVISNRIFETVLYNLFLGDEMLDNEIYKTAVRNRNRYIENGRLNMDLVLEKFVVHFGDLYGQQREAFLEEAGRRYFLLYLKPIINGVGNYYIEARTRDMERTDVIVDYCGEQFVAEFKIWRGNAYNERGERQLLEYLDYYHLEKGYLLSFNFNKMKQTGIKTIRLGERTITEAVV